MASGILFRRAIGLVLLSGMLAASTQAQFYGGAGIGVPYGYPYPQGIPGPGTYGYPYSPEGSYAFPVIPPPSTYFTPWFSYNANPYAPVPNTFSYEQLPNAFSYEMPQNFYAPNTYTYDLGAYGYGYPPPIAALPFYPDGDNSIFYPDVNARHRGLPGYRRGVYREVSPQEYLFLQLHGPVRVRDIVPGVPELGG
jgi:hypothetical protein